MSLRLPAETWHIVDEYRSKNGKKISRTAWINTAIQEKLVREQQASFGRIPNPISPKRTFCEFFAGGGMARIGLGQEWQCVFANDNDRKKAQAYRLNFPGEELLVRDIQEVSPDQLPGDCDLAWASFPCQDLSLAGAGAGLSGTHSSTFWPFWEIMQTLNEEGRAPGVIVLENVAGAVTSRGGKDFESILLALAGEGYDFGPFIIDSVHFVPQSRPRLFIVAVRGFCAQDSNLVGAGPQRPFHTEALEEAFDRAPESLRKHWRWWHLPAPPQRKLLLEDLIEKEPTNTPWHSPSETEKLLRMMTPVNRRKVEAEREKGGFRVGTLYRRTRTIDGIKQQRAEVRFDDIAGCLRTPRGGSSRQTILIVENDRIRSRLLSPREAARLMGLPDDYKLPERYNDAYHLAGDGLVVPVVSHLASHLLEPLAHNRQTHAHAAA